MPNTYKHLPAWKKVLLWVRYRPSSIVNFLFEVAIYLAQGAPIEFLDRGWPRSRRAWIGHLWTANKSIYHVRIGDNMTTQELIDELRSRV
jgi:hypothetical protein